MTHVGSARVVHRAEYVTLVVYRNCAMSLTSCCCRMPRSFSVILLLASAALAWAVHGAASSAGPGAAECSLAACKFARAFSEEANFASRALAGARDETTQSGRRSLFADEHTSKTVVDKVRAGNEHVLALL